MPDANGRHLVAPLGPMPAAPAARLPVVVPSLSGARVHAFPCLMMAHNFSKAALAVLVSLDPLPLPASATCSTTTVGDFVAVFVDAEAGTV